MSDILLLNPPFTSFGYKTLSGFASRPFPLGLGYLSGVLKDRGLPFEALDADALNLSMDRLVWLISQRRPLIIGISTYSPYADMIKFIVAEIKKIMKDTMIVLGGHHAFARREELLNETRADIIAIGEGEFLFPELCETILNGESLENIKGVYFRRNGRILYTGERENIKNLDDIPMPAYENFPMEKYQGHFYRKWTGGFRKPFGSVITSRGCPFRCGFCSNVMWSKKVRFQSPERVTGEIDCLVKNYGLRQLSFFDDTFTLDMKRAHRICDILIEKDYNLDIYCSTRVDFLDEALIGKMAKAGFKWIGIGIESGNDEILKKIQKNQTVEKCSKVLRLIADNCIAIYGNIILGYPGEDKKTLQDSLRFILNNPVHLPQFNIFVPYPGTPIYDELVAKGVRIPKNINQYSKVISYNRSISTRYLQFFLWYSYFRSLVSIRYFKLISKIFKLPVVFTDILNMTWAMFCLNRKRSNRIVE